MAAWVRLSTLTVAEAGQDGFPVLRKPYVPEAVDAAIQQAAASPSGLANVVPFRVSTSPVAS